MQKYIKILGSGHNNTTTLIISNNETEDIIKIAKSLKDSGLFLKGVTETVSNEVKEHKGGFLSMLLGILDASLLGNLLTGKGIYSAGKGKGINKAGYGNKVDFKYHLILWQTLKYKNIIKMNQDLILFILEIIYLKERMGLI